MTKPTRNKPYTVKNHEGIWFYTGESRKHESTWEYYGEIMTEHARKRGYSEEYIKRHERRESRSGYLVVPSLEKTTRKTTETLHKFRNKETGEVIETTWMRATSVTKSRVEAYVGSSNYNVAKLGEKPPKEVAEKYRKAKEMAEAYEAWKGLNLGTKLVAPPSWCLEF